MPTVTKPKRPIDPPAAATNRDASAAKGWMGSSDRAVSAVVAEVIAALDEVRRVKAIYATLDPNSRRAAEIRRITRQLAGGAKRSRLWTEVTLRREFGPTAAVASSPHWQLLMLLEQELASDKICVAS